MLLYAGIDCSRMEQKQAIYQVVVDSDGNTLLEEPYESYSEQLAYLRKKDAAPIFPKVLFKENSSMEQMLDELNEKLASGEIPHHWKYSMNAQDICFLQYDAKQITSGCEHFSHGVLFVCKCGALFSCRYCHHECADLKVEDVVCATCKQPIGDKRTCCGHGLYNYICRICGVASMCNEYAHCLICGCIAQKEVHHCERCRRCTQSGNHICQPILDDTCPICFEHYDGLLLKPVFLSCGHTLHRSCFDRMATHDTITCPLDRKDVDLKPIDKVAFNQFISYYSMTEIPQHKVGHYCAVQCQECNEKMVFNWHPRGYICCHCLSIKCVELQEYAGSAEEAEREIERQYQIVIEKHKRRPIYPLVLWPKDGQEMAAVVDHYVQMYRSFCEEYHAKLLTEKKDQIPLREVFLAYTLTRVYNEKLGFAALNLMHTRQIFPQAPLGLDRISIDTMVEVRELTRLGVNQK